MTAFRSLELAVELATRQRDAQARKHAQAIRNLEFAKNQMAQLEGYAGETDARWISGGLHQISGEMVHHQYQFRARLQSAVDLQVGVIANMQAQQEQAHAALLQAEYKLAGLRHVLGSRRAAVQLTQHRREQRVTDEFASQRYAQKAAATNLGESI
jgi:flagellar FliJ protein